jgi:FdhE protein
LIIVTNLLDIGPLNYSALEDPAYLTDCNILVPMDQLRARLERRLRDLGAARPDLERALALQQVLLNRQIDLLEVLRTGGLPGITLPAGYLATKLARGIPALHGEPVPLPGTLLALSAREFCGHLAGGGAGEAAAAVGRALDTGALDPAALLSACFGRDQRRVRLLAVQQQVSPDLAWLVAELALAPFAFLLQRRVFADPVAIVDAALRAWDRGFCPACGSWPAIVEARAGAHEHRCSFCAAGWPLSSYRCLYCGNAGESFVTAAPDPERSGRRLQLCGECGGYMKVLEGDAPTPFPLVAVEDLASMDLDMVAIERKYLRPPLPQIARRGA